MTKMYEIKCPVCWEKRGDVTDEQLETGVTFSCASCATEFTVDNEHQHVLEAHFNNKEQK